MAVWFALQHAQDPKCTKKYFSKIKEVVNRGDLGKEQFALMQDRILMNDGKPQFYGTQVRNRKLYKLHEPE